MTRPRDPDAVSPRRRSLRSVLILLALAAIAPFALRALEGLPVNNNVEHWLPEGDVHARRLVWCRENFPLDDRILISWDESSLDDPRLEAFATRLNEDVPQISKVITPGYVAEQMERGHVDEADAWEHLEGVLVGSGPLYVTLSDAGRRDPAAVAQQLQQRAAAELDLAVTVANETEGELAVRWPDMHLQPEQVAEVKQLATALSAGGAALVEDCELGLGAPVAISVSFTTDEKVDFPATLAAIRQSAASAGIDEAALHMAGSAVARTELDAGVAKASWNTDYPLWRFYKRSPVLLSGIVGIGLAFVLLRSFRLAMLVLAISYYTPFLATAVVAATGGSMNMVLVVMPTLLMVLTLSGGIHVANYWKHAAARNPDTAVGEATKMALQPCILAAVTTAIGLASLLASTLAPVRDFGLYAAIGCLISLVMVLLALPAFLDLWRGRPPRRLDADHSGWVGFGRAVGRHSTIVTIACLSLFVGACIGLRWFRTETKIIRYFPDDSRVIRDYEFIEHNLAGVVPVEAVVQFNGDAQQNLDFLDRAKLVAEIERRMVGRPEISGALSGADFIRLRDRPDDSASAVEKALYNKAVHSTETGVKEAAAEHGEFFAIADEAIDLSRPGEPVRIEAGDELWRISAQATILDDYDYGELTKHLSGIAEAVLDEHGGTGHLVTGMVPLFLRTQQAVLESLIRSFVLAFALIAIVMMILLRNPLAGLVLMLPNLLPIAVVFGMLAWFGQFVDVGTMVTASVALGIAVDGTVHLLTWFKIGLAEGQSRTESVAAALGHCGPAMLQTSAAVGLGLLMLYPADLLLVSRFGWLMAALIGAALAADIVFLPALLIGPAGRLFESSATGDSAE